MQALFESLKDSLFYKTLFEEYSIIDGNEQMNESFKSELLLNLANNIKKAEQRNNINKQRQNVADIAQGYSGNRQMTSFASIFGPLTINLKYGGKRTGVQGIKWNTIEDTDFVFVKAGDVTALKKALKPIYGKDGKGDVIVCDPGTKNPVMFIKAYGDKDSGKKIFYFNYSKNYNGGVKEITKQKYSYQTRSLKFDEVLPEIENYDVYILTITDDMIKNYTDLHVDRENSQKGVINTDEKSLKELLKKQQARYEVMVKEIRAKKLQEDPNILFDEIKQINDDVVALYKKVMDKPENMDMRFDLGEIMRYVAYSYESFYSSMKDKRSSDKRKERAKERAKERGEEFKEKDFDDYNYDAQSSKENIRNAKEYINKVKKMIKNIEDELK